MPLEILLVLVVGGITGIAILSHSLGLSKRRAFQSADDAQAAWQREYPSSSVTDIILSQSGYAALIQTRRSIGVVWTMGDDTCARILRSPKIARVKTGLRLRLADYAAPVIKLELSTEETALWAAKLEGQS